MACGDDRACRARRRLRLRLYDGEPRRTFKQNQPSGQPVVWRVPAQSITYNFGGSVNATAARALRP